MFSSTQLLRLNTQTGMTLALAEDLVRPEATKQELSEARGLFRKAAITGIVEIITNTVAAIFYGLAIIPLASANFFIGTQLYRNAKRNFGVCLTNALATTRMLPVALISRFKPTYAGAVRIKQTAKLGQRISNFEQKTAEQLAKRMAALELANSKNTPEDQIIVTALLTRFNTQLKNEIQKCKDWASDALGLHHFERQAKYIQGMLAQVAAKVDNCELLFNSTSAEDYMKAAERGHANSLTRLGVRHKSCESKAATTYYKKGLEKGSLFAAGNLANYYARKKDDKQAFKYAKIAHDLSHECEMGELVIGKQYFSGKGSLWQNTFKAALHFHKGALGGNDKAQYSLAKLYETGTGVSFSPRLAIKWALKAANTGNTSAMLMLARSYEHGLNYIKIDKKTALDWYRKAGHRAKVALLEPQVAAMS